MTEEQPIDAELTSEPALDPNRWLALGAVLTASFLTVLDFFVVNVALPSIQSDLKATFGQVELVIAAYALAFAVLLITGGRLGDIYGRKRTFLAGMVGFTAASAFCGLAVTPWMLIGSRVLQGLAGAIMVPQILALMQVSFPQEERARAFALFGTASGLAAVCGQLLGGLCVSANLFGLSWRPIFLINIPVGIAAVWAARRWIVESRASKALKLDLGGVAILSAALSLFMLPIVEGREEGWPLWMLYCFLASLGLFGLFARYERWIARHGGSPLIEFSLFRHRMFRLGLGVAIAYNIGLAAFYLTFTLFLQRGLRTSPLATGLTFVPIALGFTVASRFSEVLSPRLGTRLLAIGMLLMATGVSGCVLLAHAKGVALQTVTLIPWIVLYGIGQGCTTPPLFNTVMSGVDHNEAGSASGLLSTAQQISSAIGVACIGAVFFGIVGKAPDPQRFVNAFASTLRWNATLLVLSALLVFLLPAQVEFDRNTSHLAEL